MNRSSPNEEIKDEAGGKEFPGEERACVKAPEVETVGHM